MKKKNKIIIIILVLFFVLIAVCLIKNFPVILKQVVEYGDAIAEEYYTENVKEYGKWNGHIDGEKDERLSKSGLFIFPSKTKQLNIEKYIYSCKKTNLSVYTYLIYARVKYNEQDYKKETERLTKINCKIAIDADNNKVKKSIEYSEKLFKYPAYIAIYCSNSCFEYALLDEENREINYVFTRIEDANGIIDDKYLPIEFVGKNMYKKSSWNNINIYWAKNSIGGHSSYEY